MKKILSLFCLIIVFHYSKAQTTDFYGKPIDVSNICNSLGFSDEKEAKNYLDQICSAAGIRSNFIMVQCNSIGTCLAIEKDGDPFILYDNVFLNSLKANIAYGFTEKKINANTEATKDWSSMAILAHEIGHHVNQHFSKTIRSTYSIKELELQADEFAGHTLYSLGATLQQGEKAFLSNVVSVEATFTHPGRADRIKAFEFGYNNEKARFGNSNNGASNSTNSDLTNAGAAAPNQSMGAAPPNQLMGAAPPSANNSNPNSGFSPNLILGNWINNTGEVSTYLNNNSIKISLKEKIINEGQWSLVNNMLRLKLKGNTGDIVLPVIGLDANTLTLKRNDNSQSILTRTNITAEKSAQDYLVKNWNQFVYVEKFNVTVGPNGGISNVNIPLVNNTDYVMDLIRVKIDYAMNNTFADGTIYKCEYIDFVNIAPHTRTLIQAQGSDKGFNAKTTIDVLHSIVMNMK